MNATSIEWCDFSSQLIRYRDANGKDVWACAKISPGCAHCYSEAIAERFDRGGPFTLAQVQTVTPYFAVDEAGKILKSKKLSGKRVFIGDMTDVFGAWVPDDLLDRMFAVFALRPDVTFQVLTKRPERMEAYLNADSIGERIAVAAIELLGPGKVASHLDDAVAENIQWFKSSDRLIPAGLSKWPLPNVHLGTSCENQATLNERVPHLMRVPAATRFLSVEPLLGPINLYGCLMDWWEFHDGPQVAPRAKGSKPDWIIVGGESGHDARACSTDWIRSIVEVCRKAEAACFVKQLGSNATTRLPNGEVWPNHHSGNSPVQFSGDGFGNYSVSGLKDRKGGDMEEWPTDLRVREFPSVATPDPTGCVQRGGCVAMG